MKKSFVYLIIAVIALVGIVAVYSMFTKKSSSPSPSVGQNECSKYSNKDGYTGCMSVVSGKDKKCTFKVDNKVNPETQKMEATYSCLPK